MMRGYLAPIRGKLIAGACCALISGLMALAIPQALRVVVDRVLSPDSSTQAIWLSAAAIGLLGLLQVLFTWFRRGLVMQPTNVMEMNMRMALFSKLVRLPVSFHDSWPSGQLLARSMSDLSVIRRWYAFGLIQSVTSSMIVLIGMILLFANAWQLALIYLLFIGPILWIIFRTIPTARTLTRHVQQHAGNLATTVEESVHGIRVLKALGRSEHALEGFAGQADALMDQEISRTRKLSGMSAKTWMIPELALAICLLVGGWLVVRGPLTTGDVVAFFATAVLITARVRDASTILNIYLSSRVARERHAQVISAPGEEQVPITGVTHPAVPHQRAGQGAAVEVEELAFAYGSGDEQDDGARPTPVLSGVQLSIEPGSTVALVGATGAGKSTLLMLLPRLYEADGGRILLDGEDAAEMPLDELRAQMALAFEEPTLFSASVRENVLMGLPELTDEYGEPLAWEDLPEAQRDEREQLLASALRVAAAEFVWDLPQGAETQIGEEGLSLSGGQRQRLSLARAIAAHPRVLLLDDPLSAVDTRTEAAVIENLREELTGTTTLLTAHRPSTVALADRVALLEEGRITAVGTHRQLLDVPAYRAVMSAEDEPVSGLDAMVGDLEFAASQSQDGGRAL